MVSRRVAAPSLCVALGLSACGGSSEETSEFDAAPAANEVAGGVIVIGGEIYGFTNEFCEIADGSADVVGLGVAPDGRPFMTNISAQMLTIEDFADLDDTRVEQAFSDNDIITDVSITFGWTTGVRSQDWLDGVSTFSVGSFFGDFTDEARIVITAGEGTASGTGTISDTRRPEGDQSAVLPVSFEATCA